MLSEATTQALGLTFHELATNALKYGEVGNSPDALKVEWRLQGAGDRLSLSWRETNGAAVTPPETPGFGTRLIDMNITRELKGTIRRDYRDDGLHIEIEIPLDGEKRAEKRKAIPAVNRNSLSCWSAADLPRRSL